MIDWGLTPFLNISHLYHGGQFTYSCIYWFSHTSTPQNNLPKQLAAFTHRLSPLVEDKWRMSILGKKFGRTHNPWIDSPRRYRLNYLGSAICFKTHEHTETEYWGCLLFYTVFVYNNYNLNNFNIFQKNVSDLKNRNRDEYREQRPYKYDKKLNIAVSANNTDSGESTRNELSILKSTLFAIYSRNIMRKFR